MKSKDIAFIVMMAGPGQTGLADYGQEEQFAGREVLGKIWSQEGAATRFKSKLNTPPLIDK